MEANQDATSMSNLAKTLVQTGYTLTDHLSNLFDLQNYMLLYMADPNNDTTTDMEETRSYMTEWKRHIVYEFEKNKKEFKLKD